MKANPRPDYKKTDIGEIPKKWDISYLESKISLSSGRFNPRKNLSDKYKYPVYGGNGLTGYFYDYMTSYPTIVIGRVGEYCGSIHLAKSKSWITDNAIYIRKLDPSIELLFLYYYLYKANLRRYADTTGQPKLTQNAIYRLVIPVPSLLEQQKIASILSTVDDAIQKTDEIIAKTEDLKKGLMQMLLTRGIGHTRFKKTEVGEIPEKWDIVRLVDVIKKVKQVDPRKHPESIFRYVDVSGISQEMYKIVAFKKHVGKKAPHRARKPIRKNDIIFATVRPYLKRVAIVPDYLDREIASTAFTIIRCIKGVADYRYIFYTLLTNRVLAILKAQQRGSNYPAVSDKDLYNLKIPLPPFSEQQKIADILTIADKKIKIEVERKEKLIDLKKGLMQVLLTGKLRVRVGDNA